MNHGRRIYKALRLQLRLLLSILNNSKLLQSTTNNFKLLQFKLITSNLHTKMSDTGRKDFSTSKLLDA